MEYDLIVIGTGPGGEGAAMMAAKEGARVAVVEKDTAVGGSCTHTGTIPSKSLRHAVQQWTDSHKTHWMSTPEPVQPSYADILQYAKRITERQVEVRGRFYSRNNVDIYRGTAFFQDPNTVCVLRADDVETVLKAKAVIIASGSRPYRPPGVDFSHERIRDSDTILQMEKTPRSITIYGAGVIGCEYASIFRALDCKVNLVNTRDSLLSFLDDEIIDALSYHLRDQGVLIRHNEEFEKIEPEDDGVILHLKSGKKLKTDILLWANGRAGNTGELALDKVGLKANSRGQLEVNEHFQTATAGIYAVGDVIGYPSLASAAYNQGRYAAGHYVSGSADLELVKFIPTGIYTIPEISSVGRTEKELTADGVPYEVGHAHFRSLAKAQITGDAVGMLKILFHRDSLEILGIHCFGAQASEIIHIGQVVISQTGEANSLKYFIDAVFNYPTMAEAYRVAALNGLNRLF